ncbi:MAG: FGGY-family carbohydrate kinase, partial [Steroidobacteraceae bacterium]
LQPGAIRGVGFDATCSLVALDAADEPVSVSPTGTADRNVVLWMDHRALAQAERINATRHEALRFVGGVISPEMQPPKLLWIKENLPQTWARAARFLDLPDFLCYRATGRDVRSLCTTTCKWAYRAPENRWDDSFFAAAGLKDLTGAGHDRIGTDVRPQGERAGVLTAAAASDLGLAAATPVGVSIIDAHAGGIGVLGMQLNDCGARDNLEHRLALICGTSSCHMAVAREARFIPGVWGPYFSAMIPGWWLNEGGQSATGPLIDHVIRGHVRGRELLAQAQAAGASVYEVLNLHLASMSRRVAFPAQLTRDLHVYPDFHGNRSPLADPGLRGMISGLSLDESLDSLATLYLAAIQAVALGTRHIIETFNRHGYRIDTLIACGGGTKNEVLLREHADATGCRVVLPAEPEAVLLGAAILGAVACGDHASITDAMAAMSRPGRIIEPASGVVAAYHEAKWQVHQMLREHQRSYVERMHA